MPSSQEYNDYKDDMNNENDGKLKRLFHNVFCEKIR